MVQYPDTKITPLLWSRINPLQLPWFWFEVMLKTNNELTFPAWAMNDASDKAAEQLNIPVRVDVSEISMWDSFLVAS